MCYNSYKIMIILKTNRSLFLTNYNMKDILAMYRERVDVALKNHNLNYRTRTFESQIKKYIKNRSNQLGTFLEDGKILFDVECEEDLTATNPRLKRGCFQYYLLEDEELIAYIGFRTKLRHNKMPKNPQTSFLTIYLMEVLNDFYTTTYQDKMNLIKKLDIMFSKGAKYKKLIIEAYENLYFQCPDNLTISEFKNKFNIKGIFTNFYETLDKFDKYNYILENSIKGIEANQIDQYLIKNSFKDIVDKMSEKDLNLPINEFEFSVKEGLEVRYENKSTNTINKLYCRYPIYKNINLYNEQGHLLRVSYGTMDYYKILVFYFNAFRKILEFIKNSFRELLNGPTINSIKRENYSSSYFLRNKYSYSDSEKEIHELVKSWIEENSYCKKAYSSTISKMEMLKRQNEFAISKEEVDKIRLNSAKIQEKLIIEDETPLEVNVSNIKKDSDSLDDPKDYFKSLQKSNLNQDSTLSDSKENSLTISNLGFNGKGIEDMDNEYALVIKALDSLEYEVLRNILEGDINEANEIASNKKIMLSLVIDNINSKASEITQDIIIEDMNIVEDYKDQLMKVLA